MERLRVCIDRTTVMTRVVAIEMRGELLQPVPVEILNI